MKTTNKKVIRNSIIFYAIYIPIVIIAFIQCRAGHMEYIGLIMLILVYVAYIESVEIIDEKKPKKK